MEYDIKLIIAPILLCVESFSFGQNWIPNRISFIVKACIAISFCTFVV